MQPVRGAIAIIAGILLTGCDSYQAPTAEADTMLRAALRTVQGRSKVFTATDLGTLGGQYSHALGINNAGLVAGNSWTSAGPVWHAFIWKNGVMTDLGTLGDESYAVAINSRGQVIGHNRFGNAWRAFVWDHDTMTDLGTLGGDLSFASAINDAGLVIGYGPNSAGEYRCFLWSNGVMTDLGTLGGTGCLPLAINNAGQIVGSSGTAGGLDHAFLWDNGVMTDLGTLGTSGSQAVGINNRGQVVGNSGHAFLWDHAVLTDLGTLGGASSTVLPGDIVPGAINDAGQIAGVSQTSTGEFHAFLWERGVMTDLGKFPGRQDAIGWAINNAGEMIGTFQYLTENCAVDHVFHWAKGVMIDLPTIQTGAGSECPTNWPDGINNAGQIVGTSDGHAVLWQPNRSAVPGR